jgi:acetolactate synthase-1/2/3 large subunit
MEQLAPLAMDVTDGPITAGHSVAHALGRAMAQAGVRHAFGVVGNGNLTAVNGLRSGGCEFIAARHEGGAMAMAEAYVRASGRPSVCSVTLGPGFTNLMTGLVEAQKARSPVLVLAGDGPAGGPLRPSDIDQAALVGSLGVPVIRVTHAASARSVASQAMRLAREDGGPVVVLLPSDLQDQPAIDEAAEEPDGKPPASAARPASAPAQIAEVSELLTRAQRVLIVAGWGAWTAGAQPALVRLADATGAALATTLPAHGMFDGHPFALGIAGGFSSPGAAELMGEADLVIALGASLSPFTTRFGTLFGDAATVVHVDLSPASPAQRPDVHLAVTADAREFSEALLAALPASEGAATKTWRLELAGRMAQARWAAEPYADEGDADHVDPRSLTSRLEDLLPSSRSLVMDGGHFACWPNMYLSARDPAGFLATGMHFHSIGLGFGSAVGVATGRPDRTTVAILGDGGARMGLADLETLIRLRVPAIIVIYDDGSYGAEIHQFGPRGEDLEPALFPEIDFAAIARALGAEAVTVRRLADVDVLSAWLAGPQAGPLLLDCKVAPQVMASLYGELH